MLRLTYLNEITLVKPLNLNQCMEQSMLQYQYNSTALLTPLFWYRNTNVGIKKIGATSSFGIHQTKMTLLSLLVYTFCFMFYFYSSTSPKISFHSLPSILFLNVDIVEPFASCIFNRYYDNIARLLMVFGMKSIRKMLKNLTHFFFFKGRDDEACLKTDVINWYISITVYDLDWILSKMI